MLRSLLLLLIGLCACMQVVLADNGSDKIRFDDRMNDRWNAVRRYALAITDDMCSSDLLDTLEDSHFIYLDKGLSPEVFVQSLDTVMDVSGDIIDDGVGVFRSQLLLAFRDFANAIDYKGNLVSNRSYSVVNLKGISKPVFFGHKAPVEVAAPTNSTSAAFAVSPSLFFVGFSIASFAAQLL
ncbi:hypothetical protein HDU97_008135 [Phlyctochytrium planicorne]|nr:hypothetical protein HDU97_008135 [Phlyctochytrium planicorne]